MQIHTEKGIDIFRLPPPPSVGSVQLKKTETRVRTRDGSVYIEKLDSSGLYQKERIGSIEVNLNSFNDDEFVDNLLSISSCRNQIILKIKSPDIQSCRQKALALKRGAGSQRCP